MALEASQPQGLHAHSISPLSDHSDQPPHVKRQRRMAAVLLLSSSLAMLEERATSLPGQAPRLALPPNRQPQQNRQKTTLSEARGLSGSRLHAKSITITHSRTSSEAAGASAGRGKADVKGISKHKSALRACGLARVYQRSVATQHLPEDYWECFPAGSKARQLLHRQQEGTALQRNQQPEQQQQPVEQHAQHTAAGAAPDQHTMISPPGPVTAGLQHAAASATAEAIRPPGFAARSGSGVDMQQIVPTEPSTGHTAALGGYGQAASTGIQNTLQLQPVAGQPDSMSHGASSAAGAAGLQGYSDLQGYSNQATATGLQQPAGVDQGEGGGEEMEEEEEGAPELPPASPTEVPELPPASPTQDEWEDI